MIRSTKNNMMKAGSEKKEVKKKTAKSLSKNNKKLENMLSKMDIINNVPINNSVLTQRKKPNSHKKKSTVNA